jgi:hydrogenase nickel incorporation protein HypA/HybF
MIEKPNLRELQIVQSIFDQVLHQVKESAEMRLNQLQVALGELSELDPNFIQKYWKERSNRTIAEQAQLHIRLITAEVQCMACFQKYRPMDKKIPAHIAPHGSFGAKNPDWRGVLP